MKFSQWIISLFVVGILVITSGMAGYFVGYDHGFGDGYNYLMEGLKPVLKENNIQ